MLKFKLVICQVESDADFFMLILQTSSLYRDTI